MIQTRGELAAYLTEDLTLRHGQREAAQMAAWILEDSFGWTRVDVILEAEQDVPMEAVAQVQGILRRLREGEPLQYILGKATFLDLELTVDPRVLIPRPETEELVMWACELLDGKAPHVLDVGTGSGCIALGIKQRIPAAQVWGCDVSAPALEVATANGVETGLEVQWMQVNILEEEPRVPPLQLLVSNPPCIGTGEAGALEEHVVAHEPHLALFAEGDPLLFYQALAVQGETLLAPGGQILVEMHSNYAAETKALFERSGYQTEMRQDLQGRWRMLRAWK